MAISKSVNFNSSGGAQNGFTAVAVAGQPNIVPIQPDDNFTYLAGTNAVITTNPAAKSVTFANSGYPPLKVINAYSVVLTSVFTTNNTGSWVNWPGMAITLTPTTAASKFAIYFSSSVGNNTYNSYQFLRLTRNSVPIATGPSGAGRTECWMDASLAQQFINNSSYIYATKSLVGIAYDSVTGVSPLTYQIQAIVTGAGIAYFGRTANTGDNNRSSIPSSLIIKEYIG